MNAESDAANMIMHTVAETAVKGGEVALKFVGSGAKHLIALLIAMKNDPHRHTGHVQLKKLLSEDKPTTVITMNESQLDAFAKKAKQYRIAFAAVKDKSGQTQECDIVVRAQDAAQINRILDKLEYANFKMTAVEKTFKEDGLDGPFSFEISGENRAAGRENPSSGRFGNTATRERKSVKSAIRKREKMKPPRGKQISIER